MILYGTVRRVAGVLTTDAILAPELRDADDPAVLAANCLAAFDPDLAERVREGDLLLTTGVAGAGEGAEVAALALLAAGFAAVLCAGAAPAFAEGAGAAGLAVLIAPEAVAALADGVVARLDLERGQVTDTATGARYAAEPLPPQVVAAVRQTQLLARMRQVVDDEGFDG